MDKRLLQKYLDGLCTPEEKQLVDRYLASDEVDVTSLQELLQRSWAVGSAAPIEADTTQRMLARLRETLYAKNTVTPVRSLQHRNRKRLWYGAACVALLLSGAALFRSNLFNPTAKTPIAVIEWKTIVNTSSTTRVTWLPDSSRVWLMPKTVLSYAAAFHQHRSVKLEGEAFFDVTHDTQHPFTVFSGNISTRVLGTAFNIESYPREKSIRVSLVRGKVSVQDTVQTGNDTTAAALEAGQVFTYDRSSRTHHKDMLGVTDPTQWTNGYMVLNDVLVTDAISRIASRYDLKVVYHKQVQLENKRVSTVFRQENLEQMLNLLLFVHQYTWKIHDQTLEIIPPH